jgi:hypothetical protein
MADTRATSWRRDFTMTSTAAPKKLTTSAMIASFADPGQRTSSAPFGHALTRLADRGLMWLGSRLIWRNTPICTSSATPIPAFFQMAWPSQLCSARLQVLPRWAW